MSTTFRQQYAASPTALTITVASLTNNSARQSTAVDNSSTKYDRGKIVVKLKSGGSGTSSSGYVNVYIAESVDGGTTYAENAGASDAAITLASPTNLRQIGTVNVVANGTTYIAAFDTYNLPDHFVIVVENKTGGTLDSTGGNHSVTFQGINAETN